MAVFARGAQEWQGGCPSLSGLASLFAASPSHRLSAPGYGYQLPTTEGAGRHYLFAERGHRGHESREGDLKYHPS